MSIKGRWNSPDATVSVVLLFQLVKIVLLDSVRRVSHNGMKTISGYSPEPFKTICVDGAGVQVRLMLVVECKTSKCLWARSSYRIIFHFEILPLGCNPCDEVSLHWL